MEVVVKDVGSQELEAGDVIEVISKFDKKYYFIVMSISGRYVLREFDGTHHLGGDFDSLTEILNLLEKDDWVKEYKIYSKKYYKLVVEPK
jgi:hypothetical protein